MTFKIPLHCTWRGKEKPIFADSLCAAADNGQEGLTDLKDRARHRKTSFYTKTVVGQGKKILNEEIRTTTRSGMFLTQG